MSWQECDLLCLRREFVKLASVEGANMSALCRQFGVSRKTGYKWRRRFLEEGESGLHDRSRRPLTFRESTPAAMEARVLAVRDEHPVWGGRKIRARLMALGESGVPAASTITAILRRHGRIADVESSRREAYQRFERSAPNELWQIDFKGEFKMSNGRYCYPLTLLDDHPLCDWLIGLWQPAAGHGPAALDVVVSPLWAAASDLFGQRPAVGLDEFSDASHSSDSVADAFRCASHSRHAVLSSRSWQGRAIPSNSSG